MAGVTHLKSCRSLGWNLAEGKVTFGGLGDSNLTFTHRADVARYIADVFTRIPPSELAWKSLRIQGDLTVSPFSTYPLEVFSHS